MASKSSAIVISSDSEDDFSTCEKKKKLYVPSDSEDSFTFSVKKELFRR